MAGVSLKAIGCGIVTDLGLTNLLVLPVLCGVMASPQIQLLPEPARITAWQSLLQSSPAVYTIGLVLGCLASACGGWVAAAVAKRRELLHGAFSASGCIALGVYGWIQNPASLSPTKHMAFLGLSLMLGLIGAAAYVRRGRHRAEVDAAAPERRTRASRLVLAMDYVMIGVAGFVTIVFVTYGVVADSAQPGNDVIGAFAVAVYGVLLLAAYGGAAHTLRRRLRYRWLAHLLAVGVTLVPVVLAN